MCKLKYGYLPIIFFLKGKNFYKERKKWIEENKLLDSQT
jgi:hypothetical protein